MTTPRRRLVRERVLQALYAYELSREPIAFIEENFLQELKSRPHDFIFATELIQSVVRNQKEVDRVIRSQVKNWDSDRIAIIDKIILRIAISELLYFRDIPPKVTLNEAIEVAKIFSTEHSPTFVNGILDSIFRELKSSKQLKKSG